MLILDHDTSLDDVLELLGDLGRPGLAAAAGSGPVTVKVTTERRSSDYMAYLNDDPRLWGCGSTRAEAAFEAIRAHYDLFPGMPGYKGA